jgi:hypothetical protein
VQTEMKNVSILLLKIIVGNRNEKCGGKKKSKNNLNVCQKKKKIFSLDYQPREIHALDIPFCIIVVVYIMFVKELMAHRDYKDRRQRRLIKMIEMRKSHTTT